MFSAVYDASICVSGSQKKNRKLLFNDILFLHFFALLYTFFCGSPQRISHRLCSTNFCSLDIGCAKGISISQFSFSPFCFAFIVFVYRRFFVDRAYHHLLFFLFIITKHICLHSTLGEHKETLTLSWRILRCVPRLRSLTLSLTLSILILLHSSLISHYIIVFSLYYSIESHCFPFINSLTQAQGKHEIVTLRFIV